MSPATKSTIKNAKTSADNVQVVKTDISEAEAKQNRQFMIIMISVMAVIVLVGGYVSYKLIKTYIHKADQIKAEDKYIQALEQKQKDLQQLQQNYQVITQKGANNLSKADLIYHALPLNPEYKSLIGVIENIGNANGIKASVTPTSTLGTVTGSTTATNTTSDTTTTGSTPQKFGFSVTLSSNYDQLVGFLQGTEQSLRPIGFITMNISGTTGDNISSTIQFNTYYQGEADISDKQESLK